MSPPPTLAVEFLSPAEEIEQRPLPRSSRLTLHVLVLLLLAGGLWAAVAEIDRVVTASGRLVTTTATIVAQPLETSVIRSIAVRPGDLVHKGQVLVTFDPTFTAADVGQLDSRRRSLDAQILRLEAELANVETFDIGNDAESLLQAQVFAERRQAYDARLQQYDESATKLDAKLATNRRDQEVLRQRVSTLNEILAMRAELLRKESGSKLKLLEARDQMLEIERQLGNAIHAAAELKQELAVTRAARAAFVTDWRQKAVEELVTARRDRDTAVEQLNKALRRKELTELTAPDDAVVLEVAQRSVGSVVQPAEPLVTLVPANAALEAEVRIDPRDVGLLRGGDTARIKLEAFPFQRHGTLPARLRTLSEDAFAGKEGDRQGAAYYVARLDIEGRQLRAVPPDTRLLPGLTLTSEIVVGRRTVLSYFAYPLLRTFDESLREP